MNQILEELKEKIKGHHMAMMDAPYFGWSGEFINGYSEALKRLEKDIEKLENKYSNTNGCKTCKCK